MGTVPKQGLMSVELPSLYDHQGEMKDGTEFQEEDFVTIVGKPPRFNNSEGEPELFLPGAKGKSKGKSKGPKNKGPKGKGHGPKW